MARPICILSFLVLSLVFSLSFSYCIYEVDESSVVESASSSTILSALLTLSTESDCALYGADVTSVKLEVTAVTNEILRVTFTDPNNERWQVCVMMCVCN